MTIVDGGNAFSTFTDVLDGGNAFTVYPLPGPDVTLLGGETTAPAAMLELTELRPGTASLTMYRSFAGYDGRTVDMTVRSAIRKYAVGAFSGSDAEIPIGVPVSYWAEMFDDGGTSLGRTESTTVTFPSAGGNVAWISDPLDETSGVRVLMIDQAGNSLSRPVSGSRYQVGFRTVVLAGTRTLLVGQDMSFLTETVADRLAIYRLMEDTGGLVLIRSAPPKDVPRLLYCWASDPKATTYQTDSGMDLTRWVNPVDEISPIEGDVAVPRVPYQAYMDAFPTYGDAMAAYETYFDAKRNPPGGF
ncbi:hypothetical protein [Curtobacterium sp. MCBA15_004]|uniref:hypothetical protein n=1 Tax=Curtobacterium sp. MCBA15_004 TaxID=1898733 RepID=UPI0008DCF267|nr:hypothetical protein [Curtobacterium sp. MCBA15_004]WIA95797.1 hypothetical protein QOL16_11825 [Curtobacterium sp. MCBA15_004]